MNNTEVLKLQQNTKCLVLRIDQNYQYGKRIILITYTVHGDVRLPNICFSSTFAPVLIDFDFCYLGANRRDIGTFSKELIRFHQGINSFLNFGMVTLTGQPWPHQ